MSTRKKEKETNIQGMTEKENRWYKIFNQIKQYLLECFVDDTHQ